MSRWRYPNSQNKSKGDFLMLTTVFTLNNADFSGKGFPNLFPYIRKNNIEVAYDFHKREGALKSLVRPDELFASTNTLDTSGETPKWVPAPVLYSEDEKGIQHIDDRQVRLEGLDFFRRNNERWYTRESDFTLLMRVNVQSVSSTSHRILLDVHNGAVGSSGFTLGVRMNSQGYSFGIRLESVGENLPDSTVLPFNKEVYLVLKNTGGVISIELPEYDTITSKDISELEMSNSEYIFMPNSKALTIGGAAEGTIARVGVSFSTIDFVLWNVSLSTSELKEQIAMLSS